jgi:hypothetical protein
MHCELLVPGLLASGPSPASLELLAARGRHDRTTPRPLEGWLQQAFGLSGKLNAGAISLLGAGGAPGDASWTRADPVHMRVERERVLMVPATAFPVSREFRVLDQHRWCARLARDMDFGDEPPLEMAGRDATTGPEDALLTEVQMLLHNHPVNEAREARGEPVLNSVWLWGAGRLPGGAHCRWQSMASADPFALGLAKLAGASARPPPANADAWLAQTSGDGRHLVTLDPAESLERDWFAPLAAALRASRIGMLSLHVPEAGLSFETIRGDLRRFWRRRRALASYA